MPNNLGPYLGRKDREHVTRWVNAMMAGRRAKPTCEGVTKLGVQCRRQRLHGARFCSLHCKGGERDRIDAARLERQRRIVVYASPVAKARALKQIRNIENRMTHRAWLKNPEAEGCTLELSSRDERRVREFLLSGYGLNIDAVDAASGRPLTPRAVDRARWAAFLGMTARCSEEAVGRRIFLLLRDDRRYWALNSPPCRL
jgi:hypothetical protein